MCFNVTNKNFKIAKEDIVVYKIAKLKDNNIVSLVKGFKYSQKEIKPIKLKIKHGEIEEGWHSYCCDAIVSMIYKSSWFKILIVLTQYENFSFASSNNIYSLDENTNILLKCTIPKGTKYLTNNENQIVSELIKIDSYTKVNLKETVQDITFDEFYNLNKQ